MSKLGFLCFSIVGLLGCGNPVDAWRFTIDQALMGDRPAPASADLAFALVDACGPSLWVAAKRSLPNIGVTREQVLFGPSTALWDAEILIDTHIRGYPWAQVEGDDVRGSCHVSGSLDSTQTLYALEASGPISLRWIETFFRDGSYSRSSLRAEAESVAIFSGPFTDVSGTATWRGNLQYEGATIPFSLHVTHQASEVLHFTGVVNGSAVEGEWGQDRSPFPMGWLAWNDPRGLYGTPKSSMDPLLDVCVDLYGKKLNFYGDSPISTSWCERSGRIASCIVFQESDTEFEYHIYPDSVTDIIDFENHCARQSGTWQAY